MNLAVIPARGGSKRIPRKNIREFYGKPIIAWSIKAALESRCFNRIIVSTDDEEIAGVAKRWGAEVPFIRPKELANDFIGTTPVVRHAIEWFIDEGFFFKHVCCIYATAPFITAHDVRQGLDKLTTTGSDYVVSVTRFPYPIQRALRITPEGWLDMFQPDYRYSLSQDLEEAYHDAGQFTWGLSNAWKEERLLFSSKTVPLILPFYRVQDIDTSEDWIRAEMIFRLLEQKKRG